MPAKLISHAVRLAFRLNSRNITAAKAAPIGTVNVLPVSNSVLCEEINDKGLLILNRPKVLNAFNEEVMKTISDALQKWQNTHSLVIIKANGKAFGAGGDLRYIVEADDPYKAGKNLLKIAYETSYLVGTLKIPYIALIDGITIGGAASISIHGKYRIATDRTLFAMPEVSVGLCPDVGASYFLPRLQGKLGLYLGLTGFRLKGTDVLNAGIATHYCENAKILHLEKALFDLKNAKDVDDLLNDFCPKPDAELSFSKHLDQINYCFNGESIEEILSNLQSDNSEWAKQTIKSMRMASPTSLKITFRQLNTGAKCSLSECLQMEYQISSRLMKLGSDFHEGIRAIIIIKDNKPQWKPARIEDVTEEHILSFFKPLPDNDKLCI